MKFDVLKDMKKFSLLTALIMYLTAGSAQFNSGVKFNKLVHDFGNVKEESEKVSTVFSFRNISDKAIYITKVETSCGCTTPEYTKDTIQPGDTPIFHQGIFF